MSGSVVSTRATINFPRFYRVGTVTDLGIAGRYLSTCYQRVHITPTFIFFHGNRFYEYFTHLPRGNVSCDMIKLRMCSGNKSTFNSVL